MQEIHGTVRAVSIVGRAPVGATITVSNWSGHALAHGTADATGSFSIPLTFASTDSYDQYLVVTGTAHGKELTEQDVEVIFDAPSSAAPVLATPATGSTVEGTPAPFPDPSAPFTITVTGTATAGDSVFVSTESAGAPEDSWSSWSQIAETDTHGRWSTVVSVGTGRWSITASAQRYNSDGEPLTVPSDESGAFVVLIDAPAGYLAPPVITTPAYPSDPDDPSDESSVAVAPAATRFL
ncbi:Ig-like domain-containing protein, partial [Kitasatospora herbaricolor]|uniref:Ig-like domain-containing protein n=1 Tax=Kitasatospora herbaricolor TaxID=68217 RepID=UPI0036DA4EE0